MTPAHIRDQADEARSLVAPRIQEMMNWVVLTGSETPVVQVVVRIFAA